MRTLLLALSLLAFAPAAAAASEADALDRAYEAADAIDAARAELEAGRRDEALELLAEAEERLIEAERAWPGLARVAFERARHSLLADRPAKAEELLLEAMTNKLPELEHLRMAQLLDEARVSRGRLPLGSAWDRATRIRGAGVGIAAGGVGLTIAGMAVAFSAFSDATKTGVDDANSTMNRVGWGLAGAGGGMVAAGTGIGIAAQVQLGTLQRVLPGPWRLPVRHSSQVSVAFTVTLPLPPG